MHPVLSRAKEVLIEVPRHGKLAYCLLRDPRVPVVPKAALLAAMGLIVSPIDFPAWIPVIGELDMLALGILAVKTFVDACPEEVVADNRAAIRSRTSAWDRDRASAAGLAREGLARLVQNWRSRLPRA